MIQVLVLGMNAPRLIATAGDDTALKHRALGVFAVSYRLLLPYVIHRQAMLMGVSIVLLISEYFYTEMVFQDSGSKVPFRVQISLVFGTVACWEYGKRMHTQWTTLINSQQALVEEKAAQETLLFMLCDSCVHIDVDGDMIIQSARNFGTMMGQEVKGTKLSDYLPDGKEEKSRVVEAFARARFSPVNLPMTLLSRWAENRMDMFIVRRSAMLPDSGQEREFGFLVGFRFAGDGIDRFAGDEIDTIDSGSDHPQYCSARAPREGGSFSGKLFGSANGSTNEHHPMRQPKVEAVPSEWDLETSSGFHFWNDGGPELPAEMCHSKLGPKAKAGTASSSPCEPQTAVVWSDRCALPKLAGTVSAGERILCYDNIANTMAYATISSTPSKAEANIDWLTVTMADGSVFRMRADQPVAAHASDDHAQLLQSRRTCVRAADLEAGKSRLMVLRMMPMLVSSVASHSQAVFSTEACIPEICVEQPERYEPLIASSDKNNQASQPIAISSCDRLVGGGVTLKEKRTFLCYEGDQLRLGDLRPIRSAPPSVCGGPRPSPSAGSALGLGIFAPTSEPDASDWGDGAVSAAIASSVSAALVETLSEQSSSALSSEQTLLDVKIGSLLGGDPSTTGLRLSSLYALRQGGAASIGTIHTPDDCRPCRFFYSRKSCRASFMCEYCHDPQHCKRLSRRLRRLPPSDRQSQSMSSASVP
jgi:hypothetical protein